MPVYFTTTIESIATFRDETDALYDPDVVRCIIVPTVGTETTLVYGGAETYPPTVLTRTSLGVYRLKADLTAKDLFKFVWYGEKTNEAKITGVSSLRIENPKYGS